MSRQPGQRRSLLLELPEDETQPGTVSYDALRWGLGQMAAERGHWAGIPMPVTGANLVIEPSFPNAGVLESINREKPSEEEILEAREWKFRNKWYSRKWRCDIILMEKDGKVHVGKLPAFHHISHDLQTLFCADAWGIDQEGKALELLSTLISERAMKHYLLTGMFLESSQRSGVTYIFRRLKPTVASAPDRSGEDMRILACLCMHPIAYYEGSWAGAMCPTDDVIAHLMLMRADEHMFWKRSNQHPPYRPEAGL